MLILVGTIGMPIKLTLRGLFCESLVHLLGMLVFNRVTQRTDLSLVRSFDGSSGQMRSVLEGRS